MVLLFTESHRYAISNQPSMSGHLILHMAASTRREPHYLDEAVRLWVRSLEVADMIRDQLHGGGTRYPR